MANPNIVATTSIYGQTSVQHVGTSPTSIAANQAASGKVLKVNSLVIASVSAQDAIVNVDVYRSSSAYYIAKSIVVPAGSSIAIFAKETPLYLNEGDSIRVSATASGAADAICSYEEIA